MPAQASSMTQHQSTPRDQAKSDGHPITTAKMPRCIHIGPVAADPYTWPYDGSVPAERVALMCIDWQTDFCGPGGYVDRMGYDIGLTRAGLPGTARMLAHARAVGMLVIHTREGHPPDLSDLPAEQAMALGPHRGGDRRARPAGPDPRARRARLGDRARGGARRW